MTFFPYKLEILHIYFCLNIFQKFFLSFEFIPFYFFAQYDILSFLFYFLCLTIFQIISLFIKRRIETFDEEKKYKFEMTSKFNTFHGVIYGFSKNCFYLLCVVEVVVVVVLVGYSLSLCLAVFNFRFHHLLAIIMVVVVVVVIIIIIVIINELSIYGLFQ